MSLRTQIACIFFLVILISILGVGYFSNSANSLRSAAREYETRTTKTSPSHVEQKALMTKAEESVGNLDSPKASVSRNPIPADPASLNDWKGPLEDVLGLLNRRSDLIKAADVLGLNLKQDVEVEAYGSQVAYLNLRTTDDTRIRFRVADQELLNYSARYMGDDVPLELTHGDGISEEAARERAASVLLALGIEYDLSDVEFRLDDLSDSDENDLRGARWKCYTIHEYQGFRTQSYIGVTISAYDGQFLGLRRTPLVIPDDMSINIDSDAAREIAARFGESLGLDIGETAVEEKVIAFPDLSVWRGTSAVLIGPDSFRSRPAYRISAINQTATGNGADSDSAQPPYFIFLVDCGNGEVIGGSGPSWR